MAKGSLIFSSPVWLWLVPVFLIGGFFLWRFSRRLAVRRMGRFVAARFVSESLATVHSPGLVGRFWLIVGVLSLLAVAAARPLFGPRPDVSERQGVDIVIALDVSKSMYVEDIKPNRLVAVKKALAEWFKELSGDRIGLVIFAGDAMVQAPLTSDYVALDQVLQMANHRAVSQGGTNIPRAIEVATAMLQKRDDQMKAIVLVTDGENFQSDAITAARLAKSTKNISIFTVGVGTSAGGKVPEDDYAQRQERGEKVDRKSYVRGGMGAEAVSTIDERSLRAMAQSGGGAYYLFDPELRTFGLLKEQSLMPLATKGRAVNTMDYVELFQIPLGFAILLLMLEPLIPTTRRRSVSPDEGDGRPRRGWRPIRTGAIAALLLGSGFAHANDVPLKDQVEEFFKTQKPDEAVLLMQAAVEGNEQDRHLMYNYGLVLYRAGKYEEAARAFQFVESLSTDADLKARAAKQVANSYFRLGQQLQKNPNYLNQATVILEQALAQYDKAALSGPVSEIRENREATVELLETVLRSMAQLRIKNAAGYSADPKNLSRKVEQLTEAVQIHERLTELKPKDKELVAKKEELKNELADSQAELGRQIAKSADRMQQEKRKLSEVLSRRQEAVEQFEAALENGVKDPNVAAEKQQELDKMAGQLVQNAREKTDKVLPKEKIGDNDLKALDEAKAALDRAQALTPNNPDPKELNAQIAKRLEKYFEARGDENLAEAKNEKSLTRKLNQTQNAADNFQKALAQNPKNKDVQEKLNETTEKLPDLLSTVAAEGVAKAEELTKQPEDAAKVREAIGHLEKATQSYDMALSLKPGEEDLEKGRQKADQMLAETRRQMQKMGQLAASTPAPDAKEMADNQGAPSVPKTRDGATVKKKPPKPEVNKDDLFWERNYKDW